jgi:Raf kinase inhibitor-like YbhB/YbcL family protein
MSKSRRFRLKSTEFVDNDFMPPQFTCDGKNVSPPLSWSNTPPGTQSFALILDDPTSMSTVGRTIVHWAVINLPASMSELTENIDIASIPDAEAISNDFCVPGYTGPCSVDPKVHIYRFHLFALKERTIDMPFSLTEKQFSAFHKDAIIGQARLTFRFIKHKN